MAIRSTGDAAKETGTGKTRLAGIILLSLLYAAGLPLLHFNGATVVYLFLFLLVTGERRPAWLVILPLLFTAACHLLFVKGFDLMMP